MDWLKSLLMLGGSAPAMAPRAEGGSTMISVSTPQELEEALRRGSLSASGQPVTDHTALKIAAVFACVRIRTGAIANTPVAIKRRVDARTREDASDHPAWLVLTRKPNKWQTPQQFKRMLEAHLLLRGNAYAVKSIGVGGKLLSLTPLHPDRVRKVQLPDMSLKFVWTRLDGAEFEFAQEEMFHLTGLTLDGVNGVSVLRYARETIGEALALQQHGSTVFRNGANVSGAFKMPAGRSLTQEQADQLRTQLDEYRQGGSRDGKVIVLEDGLEYQQMALSAEDAQWLEARQFTRGDIAMFFGVPPHMIGDTEKSTSYGTGLETQSQGFVTYTLEDSFVGWEETIGLQLLDWANRPELYARFNRNALVRGDIKTRWDAHVRAMQWGVYSPNEIRALEDENPRDGGDVYYDPPNTAGQPGDQANVNP